MCKQQYIDRPMTEAEVKRIVAAAVKARGPTAGGGVTPRPNASSRSARSAAASLRANAARRAVRWRVTSTIYNGGRHTVGCS